MGLISMCHHKPVELIAQREADPDEEADEGEQAPATPTLAPPSDD